jgi:hypothetical protein
MKEDALLEFCVKFEKCFKALIKHYRQMETIVHSEHQFISESNIDELEKLMPLKEDCGLRISEATHDFMRLGWEYAKKIPIHSKEEAWSGKLTDLLILLKEESRDNSGGFKSKVLGHYIQKLEADLDTFFAVFKEVKPLVEKNKYLISKLLQRHRENIRIWQETMSSSEGTYDQTGIAKKLKHSVISTKA